MSLETLQLDKVIQQYSISELRNIPEYVKLCEAHTVGLSKIQNVIDYLSNAINIDTAEGIWLDYIGWLVGATRSYGDADRFFCVNSEDVNVEKYFWFANQSINEESSLDDNFFRRKIKAKILFNKTRCTRNENIQIIKGITFAEKVIIENVEPMLLDITLYGDNILQTTTTFNDIERVLGEGVGIRRLQIKGMDEYYE